MSSKRFAVAMNFVRPSGNAVETELQMATLWADSKEEAIGKVLPELWKKFKGYQLNNLVATEWPDPTPEPSQGNEKGSEA